LIGVSRRNRRRVDAAPENRPLTTLGERHETWRGLDYVVRTVTSSGAVKAYRCPGCDQEIGAGRPHVVTWPADDSDAADRRHWHGACWSARERRTPGVQRSRSAPRH
jgi:hypothetical protein